MNPGLSLDFVVRKMLPEPPYRFQIGEVTANVARRLGVSPLESIIQLAERQQGGACEDLAQNTAAFFRTLRPARTPLMAESSSSRVNPRRTFRDALRHGGYLARVHFHQRQKEKRLVVICDFTESALSCARGLATLACALQRTDHKVTVLGFDSEVFLFRRGTVEALSNEIAIRCQHVHRTGKRFLSMADLEMILREAGRFSPNAAQSYLLLISDLFVDAEQQWSPGALNKLRGVLRRYRHCWLVDAWPVTPPFTESDRGEVTCSAQNLLKFLDQNSNSSAELTWTQVETKKILNLPRSLLARWAQCGLNALEARRCTPRLWELGFEREEAGSGSKLTYVPQNRPIDFAMIFHQAKPI